MMPSSNPTKRWAGGLGPASALTLFLAALALAAREPQPNTLPAFDPDKALSAEEKTERLDRVKREQSSPEQVRRLLGPPAQRARQILYHRAREQWLYEAPFNTRLEFEYVLGQEPHLLSGPAARFRKTVTASADATSVH
jgi:hypothetical protein